MATLIETEDIPEMANFDILMRALHQQYLFESTVSSSVSDTVIQSRFSVN